MVNSPLSAMAFKIAVAITFLISVFGCSNHVRRAEDAAMMAAMERPSSREFCALFPKCAAIVTTLDRTNTTPKFILEGIAYGRYLVTMVIPLQVEHPSLRVTSFGTPSFILKEFKSFDWNGGNGTRMSFISETNRRFGITEWERLVQSGGDFTVLGVTPVINSPLPDIDHYLDRGRRM
jgi:hypothetical protein